MESSGRWQLQPVYWLMVVSLCLLLTNNPLPSGATGMAIADPIDRRQQRPAPS